MDFQEDSLQDHSHFLTDNGHVHSYTDRHWKESGINGYPGMANPPDTYSDAFNWPHYNYNTNRATTGISIDGASGGRIDSETRPKNMHVVFLMKVC